MNSVLEMFQFGNNRQTKRDDIYISLIFSLVGVSTIRCEKINYTINTYYKMGDYGRGDTILHMGLPYGVRGVTSYVD